MATEIARNDGDVVVGWPVVVLALAAAVPWAALLLVALVLWSIAWTLAYASVAASLREERADGYRAWVMDHFGPTPFTRTIPLFFNAATFGLWPRLHPSSAPSMLPPLAPDDTPRRHTWVWTGAIGALLISVAAVALFSSAHSSRALSAPAVVHALPSQAVVAPAQTSQGSFIGAVPKGVIVPSFVGKFLPKAEAFFKSAGLSVSVTREPSALSPGTVIDQYPPAGTTAYRSGSAMVVLAEGFGAAPNVVGKGVDGARNTLHARGYQVSIERVASSSPIGTVLAQSPAAGQRVWPGQTVTVVVAQP